MPPKAVEVVKHVKSVKVAKLAEPAPAPVQVKHVTKQAVGAAVALVAAAVAAKGGAGNSQRAHVHGGKSAFSRAVDSIGLPHVAVAEEKEENEGGSPGREMELASGAFSVLTAHGIVDKPFKPSASEEVASLVYESSKSSSLHERRARSVHGVDNKALPLIERSLILNW